MVKIEASAQNAPQVEQIYFEVDRRTKIDALTRLIEIVGEAATRVSTATRASHSAIPWPEILGLRNRIVHGYDKINLDILWQIVSADLPPLIKQLEHMLQT